MNGTTWSALADAVFAVGPVKENLRISEIMYHPADTGVPGDPNTEYIELTNIGAEALDLGFVQFTKGIRFTFPDMSLAPHACCVVVKDRAAFEARYGRDCRSRASTRGVWTTRASRSSCGTPPGRSSTASATGTIGSAPPMARATR